MSINFRKFEQFFSTFVNKRRWSSILDPLPLSPGEIVNQARKSFRCTSKSRNFGFGCIRVQFEKNRPHRRRRRRVLRKLFRLKNLGKQDKLRNDRTKRKINLGFRNLQPVFFYWSIHDRRKLFFFVQKINRWRLSDSF